MQSLQPFNRHCVNVRYELNVTESPVPAPLIDTLQSLWHLAPPGPDNLFSYRTFIELCDICERFYPPTHSKDALGIALHTALRALGLPCTLPTEKQTLGLSVADAAKRLDQAFRQTKASRVHLCPLDCADDLPSLEFGPAVVRKFSTTELEDLIDVQRLQRRYPSWKFDGNSFASFTWLVVREAVPIDGEAGKRAVPFFYTNINQDFGAIEPHRRQFPAAVEAALFALLLAPWEDWVDDIEIDWRAFRIPWVYTTDDDLFVAHSVPPRSDTLSWKPCIFTDAYGEQSEDECPEYFSLSNRAKAAPSWITHERWTTLERAREALLFGSPIAHFLNRAFLSNGIDEFLAHITVIEAGLGTNVDHDIGQRSKIKGKNPGATERVALRLSSLLRDGAAGEDYRRLFKSRSDFIHGRTLNTIPSTDRALVRKLARRVAVELVMKAASEPALPRESFLEHLLNA